LSGLLALQTQLGAASREQGSLVAVVASAVAVPWCGSARAKSGLVRVVGQHLAVCPWSISLAAGSQPRERGVGDCTDWYYFRGYRIIVFFLN